MTDNLCATVVVKVGTDGLGAGNGAPDRKVLRRLAKDISKVIAGGTRVILVSSGAVGTGHGSVLKDELKTTDRTIIKQAFAACGQHKLMAAWAAALEEVGLGAAQILLTKNDLQRKKSRQNTKNVLEAYPARIVPIINENDTTATEELTFSDNDNLAGQLLEKLGLSNAHRLIILTNVNGVFTENPAKNPNAKLIPDVYLDKENPRIDTDGKSAVGTGGMESKVAVAFRLARQGVTSHIASVDEKNVLTNIVIKGKSVGTTFHPTAFAL